MMTRPDISRRTVVSALGASALAAQAPGTLRLGVIGLGNRSRAHFAAFRHLPEAHVVALSDLDSQRIDAVNGTLPSKAAAYTDYRELIKDPQVQAVAIVAPNFLHHDMVIAALHAGKDVLVEKPLALNYADAKDIIAESKRSGRVVVVGMQRRFAQPDTRIRELVERGRIGAPQFIVYSEYRGDWNPNSWQYTDPATGVKTNWRFLKKTAGSTELEMCVHSYGFLCSLIGSPLARLTASGGVMHHTGRETRDVSGLLVEFESGARVQHALCLYAAGVGRTCAIIGERGSIEISGNKILIRTGQKPEIEEVPARGPGDPPEAEVYREFFARVRDRKPSVLSPEAVLEASKLAYAAEISITERRTVTAADFV